MQAKGKLDEFLKKVEPVEWCYDGLGGRIIQWTMDHGSTKRDGKTPEDHPSLLALIVGRDGKPFSILSDGRQYQAGSLIKWAEEQLVAYEQQHPSTRLPFVPASVAIEGEGADRKATCEALAKALEAKKPVLLYFGRGYFEPKDKTAKKENKRARKFEKVVLNSKSAAKQIDGFVLLRFDLADAAHATFATAHGITEAPSMLLFAPGVEKPQLLDRKTTGSRLADLLKRAKTPAK